MIHQILFGASRGTPQGNPEGLVKVVEWEGLKLSVPGTWVWASTSPLMNGRWMAEGWILIPGLSWSNIQLSEHGVLLNDHFP